MMGKELISCLFIFTTSFLFSQQCEWVKTIAGPSHTYGVMSDHYLHSDYTGNVYTWGITANSVLMSPDFTFTVPVGFVLSYSPDGSFKWIRTYSGIKDVDVDPAGFVYVLTQDAWYKLDNNGQQLFSKAITDMLSIKSAPDNCYLVTISGELQKFDKNGIFVSSKSNFPQFRRVLREHNDNVHVLGTYNGNDVKIDGIALEPTGDPCNCIGAFYAILDKNLNAICAKATTGSASKSGMDAAFVTSGGNYVNSRGVAYSASELIYGNCSNGQFWNKKIGIYLGNSIRAFADAGHDDLLCAHRAIAEPSGSRLTLLRTSATGALRDSLAWENLIATGVAAHPEAVYISGFVSDTTTIDNITLKPLPGNEPTFFIAKLRPSTVGLEERPYMLPLVAPNPFHEATLITAPESFGELQSVSIINVNGRVITLAIRIQGNTVEIKRNGLADGIYFCTLTSKNHQILRTKLLAQ